MPQIVLCIRITISQWTQLSRNAKTDAAMSLKKYY